MQNVIFLDFDGPLFPEKVFLLEENRLGSEKNISRELGLYPYINYWKADPFAVEMLNSLYRVSYYEIVVSSSWANERVNDFLGIKGLLKANGIEAPLHEKWKTEQEKVKGRENQILNWLEVNGWDINYLILDDSSSGDGLNDIEIVKSLGLKLENIYMVDLEHGISLSQYMEMLDKIKSW